MKTKKIKTTMCLVLQNDDRTVFRIYGSTQSFLYDFPYMREKWHEVRSQLIEGPVDVLFAFEGIPTRTLKLTKRMVY